ncbi:hypothetical protein LCGC14_2464270, partial [marine sediment metagenome]
MAIYDHFTSKVDGTYHFWPPGESEGQPRLRRTVYDPVKLLNAYGWAICGQCAHTLYGLYTTAGLEARPIGLPGHSLCEVFYEGRWHILDVDMWTWFRTPAGHIAGAYELTQNPEGLVLNNAERSDPCDLPDRSLEAYAKMYGETETVDDHVKCLPPKWSIRAHSMDFHLRPGETLIRSQGNQGRFHMPAAWTASRTKYRREWKGHPRERYEPFRTFGNGRWIYQPDLSTGSGDFAAGVRQAEGVNPDDGGLAGTGGASWRIQSPYPFCGIPDCDAQPITYSEGVWLHLAGSGPVRAEVTDPEGKLVEVGTIDGGDFERKVDITQLLSSRYDCLIRITLGEGARLRRLRFEGYLMTSPTSIPRLVAGDNPMELRCADKYGLPTVPFSQVIDFREGADLAGQWQDCSNAQAGTYMDGWQHIAPAADGAVSAVFRFDAPPGGSEAIAWAYAHGTVHEGPTGQPESKARLQWSPDGTHWRDLSTGEVSSTHLQWDCSIDGEVRFDRPLSA